MTSEPFESLMSSERFKRLLAQESDGAANDILSLCREHREKQEKTYRDLRSNIHEEWLRGWEYFEAIIFAMQQNGVAMLKRAQQVIDTHSDARSALVLIHANSTMLVYEIRSLLLEGLWSGAAARWRALHELTVTAKLVAQGGPAMADRYLQHGFVSQTDRLAKYFDAHGRGPVPEQELKRRQSRAAELSRQSHTSRPRRHLSRSLWMGRTSDAPGQEVWKAYQT